jgi:hypothetical protein
MRHWILVLFLAGCGGSRLVPPPATPQGYRQIELRDVEPLGLTDVNVAVEGVVGRLQPEAVCDGLVTFQLLRSSPFDLSGDFGLAGVTITLPRARYAEVRDLQPFARVRVRGYLSAHFAEGCSWFSRTSHRYLWVDTIERLPSR